MQRRRYKPEKIVAKLRQVDVLVSQGHDMTDAIRQIGVSEAACGTSCSTTKSSTRSPCGHMHFSAANRRHREVFVPEFPAWPPALN
jgi:hypothetical protein